MNSAPSKIPAAESCLRYPAVIPNSRACSSKSLHWLPKQLRVMGFMLVAHIGGKVKPPFKE